MPNHCIQCAKCTAECTSGIRVHEEIAKHGRVVSPSCMKDLDCVNACPEGLKFGFDKPGFFASFGMKRKASFYDYSWTEEGLLVASVLVTLLCYRYLYGFVPFLMTLGLGVVYGQLAVTCLRLWTKTNVKHFTLKLKTNGMVTAWGKRLILLSAALLLVSLHCAWIRYHEAAFNRLQARVQHDWQGASDLAAAAVGHLEVLTNYGIFERRYRKRQLAAVLLAVKDQARALPLLHELVSENELDAEPKFMMVQAYMQQDQFAQARSYLNDILQRVDRRQEEGRHISSRALACLGEIAFSKGEWERANAHLTQACKENELNFAARLSLAKLQANQGMIQGNRQLLLQSQNSFERAVELKPSISEAHYNLAVISQRLGNLEKALKHYEEAVRLDPSDPEVHNNLGYLYQQQGLLKRATANFQKAIDLNPQYAMPYYNLSQIAKAQGKQREANQLLAKAVELSPELRQSLEALNKQQ